MAANLRSHLFNVESATNAFNFGARRISEFGLEGPISWLRRIDLEHANQAAAAMATPLRNIHPFQKFKPERLSGHPAACGSAAKP